MDKHYVVIAGTGESSRANIESLVEDYLYSKGPNVVFVLAYDSRPSQGQIYAAQFIKDKNKEIVVFTKPDSKFDGLNSASVQMVDNPTQEAIKHVRKESAVLFMLWNDDDPETVEAVSFALENSVTCLDLTEGLIEIKTVKKPEQEKPSMPQVEKVTKADKPAEEPEEEPEEIEEEDEEEESDELLDEVYFGLQALIKAIAKEVVAELQKKPSKGA